MIVMQERSSLEPFKVTLVSNESIPDARCIKSTVSISTLERAAPPVVEDPASVHASRQEVEDPDVDDTDTDDYGQDFKDDTTSETVTFTHFLYTAWPDHGVPTAEDRESLLRFARLVEDVNSSSTSSSSSSTQRRHAEDDPNIDPPVIVGCSAGIGRTGSFIAINSLLRVHRVLSSERSKVAQPPLTFPAGGKSEPSPFGPLPSEMGDDMVAHEVDALRDQRPGMVQRPEQLMLVYEMLLATYRE